MYLNVPKSPSISSGATYQYMESLKNVKERSFKKKDNHLSETVLLQMFMFKIIRHLILYDFTAANFFAESSSD